ncbi:MAG: ABC transporter permease [Chlamydiota bacterium]|nr:ABC transporter permease [Chlamydiota bacterium]
MKKTDWEFSIGLALLFSLVSIALTASWICPYQPSQVHWTVYPIAPSHQFLFGTDALGRDIFSRTLYGLRLSYFVAFIVATSSIMIGTFMGLLSGYFEGKFDLFAVWIIDCFLAFPSLLLTIAICASLGPGLKTLFISLIASSWATTARIVRSHVRNVRSNNFISTTRALGAGHIYIVIRHVLPHCTGILFIMYILSFGSAILAETSLSFLGFGLNPPHPSLGRLIYDGASYLRTAPWWPILPGLFIAASIISVNLLGDSLRKKFKLDFQL